MKIRSPKAKKRVSEDNSSSPNPLRMDPSRTLTLRKAMCKDLRTRFNGLRAKILKLVVDGDAFGLKDRKPLVLHSTTAGDGPSKQAIREADFVRLPTDVKGTNCSNCRFDKEGICQHKKLTGLQVTERDCCAYWDAPGTKRSYGKQLIGNQWVPSTRILEVKDYRQPNHYWCGAEATTGILDFFGVLHGRTDKDIARELGTTVEKSTHPGAILRVLSTSGLQVEARDYMTVDDLASYVARGWPVIVPLQDYMGRRDPRAEFDYGHYLTVISVISDSPRYIVCQDSSLENWEKVKGGDVPRSQEQEDNIDAPGRIMVREDVWLRTWHDVDSEGNKYVRFGIAAGLPTLLASNTFCATGVGGGVDPTCSSGKGGEGSRKGPVARAKEAVASIKGTATEFLDKVPGGKWLREQGAKAQQKLVDRYGAKTAAAIIASGQVISWTAAGLGAATGHPVWVPSIAAMAPAALLAELHHQYKTRLAHNVGEPGYTVVNDWDYPNDWIDARAQELVTELTAAWEQHRHSLTTNAFFQESLTTNDRWAFNSDPEKLKAFLDWLEQQIGSDILGSTEDQLWAKYVEEGWKKGAGRAFDDVKVGKWGAGEGDFYQGSKEQFLRDSFGQAVSIEKVKLLASRTYTDLQGVTDQMSAAMARTLTDGFVEGKTPQEIAKDLSEDLDLSLPRAETIARTEIVRAQSEGQLDAMEDLGVTEVGVMAEWSTADDDAVCELCEPLDGIVLKIEEARNLLPRHPNCRCAWIPANLGEDTEDQKRTKGAIVKAVKASVKEEGGSEKSDWAGADREINKQRPATNSSPTVNASRRKPGDVVREDAHSRTTWQRDSKGNWSQLTERKSSSGGNCGTGSGGFQPGNTCALKGGTESPTGAPSASGQGSSGAGPSSSGNVSREEALSAPQSTKDYLHRHLEELGSLHHGYVSVKQLRDKVPEIQRGDFDKALAGLMYDGKAVPTAKEGRFNAEPSEQRKWQEERAAAVKVAGDDITHLTVRRSS